MSDTPRAQPSLLYGIFMALQRSGADLSVRDYLDGLRALKQCGFPKDLLALDDDRVMVAHRVRDELVELCQTLWARSDEERRTVERILFTLLPSAPALLVRRLRILLDPAPPEQGKISPAPREEDDSDTTGTSSASKGASQADKATSRARKAADRKAAGTVKASFHSAQEFGHVPLPELKSLPKSDDEPGFVFHTPDPLSERFLAVCWRRFRLRAPKALSTEIDIAATVEHLSQSGFLIHPVYQPGRQNDAALRVLIDVGPSMAPWRQVGQLFVSSLRPSLSRLDQVTIHYFDRVPRQSLYEVGDLSLPVPMSDFLARNREAPVLILSDGGAAVGRIDPSREKRLLEFLNLVKVRGARSIVWLNPMPLASWSWTPAAAIASYPHVKTMPLSREALLTAVDTLRGEHVG